MSHLRPRLCVASEFRVRGPQGGNDELIELYNMATAPIEIGGWKVKGSNATGATTGPASIPAGRILGAGCHCKSLTVKEAATLSLAEDLQATI